jgi:hypothetical protein
LYQPPPATPSRIFQHQRACGRTIISIKSQSGRGKKGEDMGRFFIDEGLLAT